MFLDLGRFFLPISAPTSSSELLVPRFRPFQVRSPSLGEVLKMKMNEFDFAISTVHFLTLRKWIKAISWVQADGATENSSPKERCLFCPKRQYARTHVRYCVYTVVLCGTGTLIRYGMWYVVLYIRLANLL